MRIIQFTPGAGRMYCGNCLRDNALVKELRSMGHSVLMVPLYLPLTLDEPDESAATPIFFGGISVFLEEKHPLFRSAPAWVRRLLANRALLRLAAHQTGRTRPEHLGRLTLSMLQGEAGHQAREIEDLVAWLKQQPAPDVICLSNALLTGMARRLRSALQAPVVCTLQGEDSFVDALPPDERERCWAALTERLAELDGLVASSHYFADLMSRRTNLSRDRIRMVPNGIHVADFETDPAHSADAAPVLGYFGRMSREKGLLELVAAFVLVHQRGRWPALRLKIGGSCGPADEAVVAEARARLKAAGALEKVEFHPNLDRAEKIRFLKSLSMFSVPAGYGEAVGLYLIEAWAAGVPVIQPRAAAFTELVESTGGGLLYPAGDREAHATAIERLAGQPEEARRMGLAGRRAVETRFSVTAMAKGMIEAFAAAKFTSAGSAASAAGAIPGLRNARA